MMSKCHSLLSRSSPVLTNKKFNLIWIFLLLVLVFMIGVKIRTHYLYTTHSLSPDEGVYVQQTNALAKSGMQNIKKAVKKLNENKALCIYPPPTRIGYLALLLESMRITDGSTESVVKAGKWVSCLFSMATLFLLIFFGLRFLNPISTLYALLFLSVSPMALTISRRIWADSLFGFVGFSMVYLCCEISLNSKRKVGYILLIALGSYSLLIKEFGIVIYGLCSLWVLWIVWIREKSFYKGLIFLIGCFFSALFCLSILAHLSGGFTPFFQLMANISAQLPMNQYAVSYQSGSWYRFLQGFWIICPTSTFFFLIGLLGIILKKEKIAGLKERQILLDVFLFSIILVLCLLIIPYSQNFRYLSVLYAPFYLLSGLGLWYTVSSIKTLPNRFVFYLISLFFSITLLLAATNDYRQFKKILAKTDGIDLSIRMIQQTR